ncbi:T-complex protein 10 C-terminus family protein [Leishmania donovani]|uniref:T-complex protein 10 C-terminus family protein n=1 Tax=Leishmania donovani TaxID=5661 RepID=A0A504X9V7_LEIDO|nr:T-complex protein 10 C-terminus family protein [Leishmania donovani]
MSRVSVLAGQKPKPKESFKFLRRDEGRLSYSAATAESPSKNAANGADGANINRERRDSKALREAIAYDMRNAKSHDPLGEVVVAVPRKAPPPTRAVSAPPPNTNASSGTEKPAAGATPQRRQPARAANPKKPEWVNPDIPPSPLLQAPTRSEVEHPADNYFETSYSDSYSGGAAAPSSGIGRSVSRGSDTNGADLGRYGGLTPRSAAMGAPRYASLKYEESSAAPSSGQDRNYFRRPPYTRDPALGSDVHSPAGSRSREEDELIASLEQEIKAAQKERSHYADARQQLDREKQRFESYRYGARQQMEDERADAGDRRSREQRDAQKDLRATEERFKNVSALLVAERETNRRLSQENDSLRTQLEDLTSTMREAHSIHKAEVARMRRDIDSLTRRNAELLAMAKEQQLQCLEGASASPATRQSSSSPLSVSLDPSAQRASSASYEDGDDEDNDAAAVRERRASRAAPLAVMDFTPRAAPSEAAAREKRNRQMQNRMQAEEQAMEERRRHRERYIADRKREEQEKKARHQVASGASSVKRRPSASAVHPRVPLKRHHVPTREELIGDMEEFPTEKLCEDDVVSQTALGDNSNKKEVLYRSGKREIHYANGTVKVVLPSGHTTLHFTNGDVKCTFPSGKSTYWYDAAQTMHTQMPDGVQAFEFRSTGQTEKHLPDGSKEILYPDGIYKIVRPDGSDETFYPDGEPMEE